MRGMGGELRSIVGRLRRTGRSGKPAAGGHKEEEAKAPADLRGVGMHQFGKHVRRLRGWAVGLSGCLIPVLVLAQASGEFVVPEVRSNGGTRFAYWDRFAVPPGGTGSYFTPHFPNVLGLGDAEGNPSNFNEGVLLQQVLQPNTFVTGSGAIYSFAGITGFQIDYSRTGSAPVTGVIWQVLTAGNGPRPESVRLRYQPVNGSAPVDLHPETKALAEPGTGAFGERSLHGYEWNLTGKGVGDYRVLFESTASSMALYEAQLDTLTSPVASPSLGWLVSTKALPVLRFGVAGKILRQLPDGAESRFFKAGATVTLSAVAEAGFEAVGWVGPDGAVLESVESFTVTIDEADPQDAAVSAVFSPTSWEAFRRHFFAHANALTGTAEEHLDDTISGMEADPDQDGYNNFAEYALGGNPMASDAERMVPGVESTSGLNPVLRYRRRAAPASDVEYRWEVSQDLVSWGWGTPGDPLIREMHTSMEADGTRMVTAQTTGTGNPGRPRFFRVRAQRIQP